ncbi:MAG: hypothetical protein KDA78_19300, partial [Planctomycetaceae bacterium]|nr:hypothetical protein [Planctomycetaceae bacterium]
MSLFVRGIQSVSRVFSKPQRRQPKQFAGETQALETRQLLSISKMWMSGSMLVVKADNNATSVRVEQVGSK